MHWLEEWRLNYRRKDGSVGMSREELAAKVRKRGVGCSEDLNAILERREKAVTHPRIADKIIDVVGGTQEQFDSIVAEIHRGKRHGRRRERQEANPFNGSLTRKPVVRLDASGNVLDRYASAAEAAKDMECTPGAIQKRCAPRICAAREALDEQRGR